MTESLLNFTINAAALAAFSWLFFRDYRAAEKDKRMVDREEALGRLLVQQLAFCFHVAQQPMGINSGSAWSSWHYFTIQDSMLSGWVWLGFA